ncbi:MAG: hypothetical protein V2A56_12210 [bacterium]
MDPPLRRSLIGFLAVVACILIFAWIAWGQPLDANHPELAWMTFETEHFIIHYHDGARRTADTIAKIAEEIYPVITSMYDYAPDTKFHFIVKDTDDYANGAAYYYNNKMLIWATALDYDLRGTKNWLRDVITHEYTHIIQLGAARKLSRNLPMLYLQVLGYEDEKRPDVLYGFPNVLASYPFAMTVMPNWLAEGTAQFNSPKFHYDWLDSHRDMQLRVRALNDSLLPLNEVEVFGKNSLGNEGVYNHGFSLVSFIDETYGPDALKKITWNQAKFFRYDANKSIKEALGISGQQLYDQWSDHLKQHYADWSSTIEKHPVSGDLLKTGGYANLYARFSPDGEWIWFVSNRGNDYLSQRGLWKIRADGSGKPELVAAQADGPFTFTSDGSAVVYSRIVREWNESYFADLFVRDLATDKEIRLTRNARATEPGVSSDDREIVFVVNHDGTKDLATLPLPPKKEWSALKAMGTDDLHFLTDYNDGSRAYRPRYSPDGSSILYAKSTYAGRDVMLLDLTAGVETTLIGGPGDQRDPEWADEGNAILYASDETGIFNLYRRGLADSVSTPLTNVIGGAFMPAPETEGSRIVYSEFSQDGYSLHLLENPQPVPSGYLDYGRDYLSVLPVKTFNDIQVDTVASKPYKPIFEQLFFVPRLTFDYGTVKPGVYIFSSDFLEKLNLFTGFNVNRRGEFDAMAFLDFKALRPTIFAEGYWIKRIDDARFEDEFKIIGERSDKDGNLVPEYDDYGVNYRFHLMEFDLGARMRLATPLDMEVRAAFSRYDAFLDYEDNSVFQYTYFKGKYLQARLDYDSMLPQIHGNVHPRNGTRGQLTVAREDNQFIEGFEVNATAYTLQEVYTPFNYWRLEGDITHWYNIAGDLVVQPRFRAGYLDHQVDPFMHLYIGGLYGMRGYSFYSLGGTRSVIGSLAFRHPLWEPDRPRFGWIHLDGLFLGLFADVGDAWRERAFDVNKLKRDVGAELRMKLFSWYGYPTAVTFAAARSLDEVTVTENGTTTQYEPGWRFYLTVLFDFETIFPSRGAAWRMP